MKRLTYGLTLMVISFLFTHCTTYDLLIKDGTVYDGTLNVPQQQDIVVQGDEIVKIKSKIKAKAKRIIHAENLVIAPGFIDVHAHLEPLPLMPDAESHIRQGVTTALGGPDGGSPLRIGAYLDSLEKTGVGLNIAHLIGHNTIRTHVLGLVDRPPTSEELAQMQELVSKAMQEGAFGISTGLKYLPGAYAELDEIVALAKVTAQQNGIYTSHLREEGRGLLEAVEEAINIAAQADIRVVLTHHKAMGKPMWGTSEQTLAMVDEARAKGLDIRLDQYPYAASQTGISVLIPAWSMEGGRYDAFAKRCENPILRDSIKRGIMDILLNDRVGKDISRVQFAGFNWKPELEGKTLKDWAIQEGLEPTLENAADLVIEAQLHLGARCIYHVMEEADVRRIMQHPQTMIASDGRLSRLDKGHPHPRAYSTFPRVLGHYVREEKVLSMEQAIHKMTALPASCLDLKDRGQLRKGYKADITIFNPITVKDKGDFIRPHQYPEGIEYVIINGEITVDKGVFRFVRSGKILRKHENLN
ncbi:MAG: D-aminoacylase [Bacteroidota bacterium]